MTKDDKNTKHDLNKNSDKTADKIDNKANTFSEETKKKANEFTEDATKTFSDGKTIAIIAHLHFIGWIIAYFLNRDNKTELGSFYLRQTLGIFLLSLFYFVPIVGILVSIFALILWIMSLVNALGGNTKPVFMFGDKFQEWFMSI